MRYEEYKIGEYDWLPEIPAHWQQLYIQQVSHEQKNKNIGMRENLVLSLSYGQIIRKKNVDAGLVAKDLSTYQIVDKDNIILRFTDLQNDHKSLRTGLVKERGIITAAYTCIVPTINAAYLHYALHSYDTRKVFYGMGGGVRQSIGFDDIRHMYVPVPPREEQDQIVRYLDWKVSCINKLIHGYQRQIKLLEERRQTVVNDVVVHGISEAPRHRVKAAWMDNVPHNWSEMRMKNFFTEINERSVDGHEPHLSMSQKKGLVTDDENIERRLLSESYAGGKLCQKDDLVLNRLKAHLGVFALAPQLGVISPDYTVLRLNTSRVRPLYAEYLLKSIACRRELRIRVRGIVEGFWRLYTEDLGSIYVCLPPLEEQDQILEYVQGQEQKYKFAIERIEKQIALLKEYRTRMISDVVTGQMDVRSIFIPDYTPEDDTVENEADEETTDEEVSMDAD
jgi:type I restriction enzyme, S subunit